MKKSHFLIGIGSDGTVFDSMIYKHRDAFVPAALEIWPMRDEVAARFAELEVQIGVFSKERGENRFPCMLNVFEQLESEFPDEPGLPKLDDLRAYVEAESYLSVKSLRAWMQKHPSFELAKMLNWCNRVDVLVDQVCKGMMPFDGVKEALEACNKADVAAVVVSSAPRAKIERDWLFAGLTSQVGMLLGQENGSGEEQLRMAMAQCEDDVQVLVLGDTVYANRIAHVVGGRFYPIVPGDEANSWKQFTEDVLPKFLAGAYDDEQEQAYTDTFKAALK